MYAPILSVSFQGIDLHFQDMNKIFIISTMVLIDLVNILPKPNYLM
jgi:hypothetical protein